MNIRVLDLKIIFLLFCTLLVLFIFIPNLWISSVTVCPNAISLERKQTLITIQNKTVLLGVLTTPDRIQQRAIIRTTYKQFLPDSSDLIFVFGRLPPDYVTYIELERKLYGDILILDIDEGMNNGKSFAFFWTLAEKYGKPDCLIRYDFIMKVDDDTFIPPTNLVNALSKLPKEGVFYGRAAQDFGQYSKQIFMFGFAYAMSWDLVLFLSQSEYAKNNTQGAEDVMISRALQHSSSPLKTIVHNGREKIYDHPDYEFKEYTYNFTEETIAIHQVKSINRALSASNFYFKRFL